MPAWICQVKENHFSLKHGFDVIHARRARERFCRHILPEYTACAMLYQNIERRKRMDDFYQSWFPALMLGLHTLDGDVRAGVLRECGKACARPTLLPLYRDLLAKAVDEDAFFRSIHRSIAAIDVECVQTGVMYDFCYPECGCPLHTEAGVNDAALCECSRQSLCWLMEELFTNKKPMVEVRE